MNQSSQQPVDTILTIPEVARISKMSKSKIYNLVARNEISHMQIGRNVRIRAVDLQVWLEKRTKHGDSNGLSKN